MASSTGKPACAVIGLGFVGCTTFRYLWRRGFETRGLDVSEAAVAAARERFAAELVPAGEAFPPWSVGLSPESAGAALDGASVILVAVRLHKLPDGQGYGAGAFDAVADLLRGQAAPGALVIVESTLRPGDLRRFAARLDRSDLDVAHAPERLRVGDGDEALRAVPRLVGSIDARATERAAAFLSDAGLTPVPVEAPEVSELSKLLENAFLTTCIGLIGEVTRLAHEAGVSAAAVTAAAATKPHGYTAFFPGAGIGGHCLRNDVDILRSHGRGRGVATPLLDGVARVAAEMPGVTVARLEALLEARGAGLSGARVALVGVGFKPGSPDLTEAPAIDLVRLLRSRGAEVAYLDELIPAFEVDASAVPRLEIGDLATWRPSAVVAVSGDAALSVDGLRAAGGVLLDAGGSRNLSGRFRRDETL